MKFFFSRQTKERTSSIKRSVLASALDRVHAQKHDALFSELGIQVTNRASPLARVVLHEASSCKVSQAQVQARSSFLTSHHPTHPLPVSSIGLTVFFFKKEAYCWFRED